MRAMRAHNEAMSDEKRPDALEDFKKGLGLLFRAARTAVDELPTGKLEDVVKSGAREVGRAIENVTQTIEKELFPKKSPPDAKPDAPNASAARRDQDEKPPSAGPDARGSDPPKG